MASVNLGFYLMWLQMMTNTLSVLELKENLCDETYLCSVLELRSKLSCAEVSHLICQVDSLQAAGISLNLVKQLKVSNMIANVSICRFISYSVIINVP